MGRHRLLFSLFLCVTLALAVVGCDDDDDNTGSWSPYPDETVRQILHAGQPEGARGQTLELTRVIVPAGAEIAPHTHPGMQLAVVVEGTLTYSVLTGEVEAIHGIATAEQRTEVVRAGQSVELTPGSSVREAPGMTHKAKNNGKQTVVLFLSSLFPTGAPASSPAQ